MIRFIDWVQSVLDVVLVERPDYQPLVIWKLAEEVGLAVNGLPDEVRNPVILGLDHVLRDLAPHGFVD